MKELLLEAQKLMANMHESGPPKKQNWSERWQTLNESWAKPRSENFKTLLQASFAVPENVMCQRCTDKAAIVRCQECHGNKHLCTICDQDVHEHWPFHDRDAIVNGHCVPISATIRQQWRMDKCW